jgi:hypothetical protein
VRIHYAKAQTLYQFNGAPVPNNTNIVLKPILRGRGDELIDLAQTNLIRERVSTKGQFNAIA